MFAEDVPNPSRNFPYAPVGEVVDTCIYCGRLVYKLPHGTPITLYQDRARYVHQVCRQYVNDPEHYPRPDFFPPPFVDPLLEDAKPAKRKSSKRAKKNHKGQAARRMFATRVSLRSALPAWRRARFATLYRALDLLGYRYDSRNRTWTANGRIK